MADSTRSMTVSSSSRDQPTEVGHSIVRTSQTVRLVSSSSFSHTRSFASSLSQATTSTPASGSNVQIQATSNAQYLKNVSSSILISEMDTRATSGYQRDFPFSSVQELRSSNANIAASRTLQSLTSLLLRTSPSGSDIMSANGMLELTSSQYSHSASLFFMSELSSHFIYQGGFSSFSSQIFASRNVNIKHQRPDDSLLSGPVSPHPENEEVLCTILLCCFVSSPFPPPSYRPFPPRHSLYSSFIHRPSLSPHFALPPTSQFSSSFLPFSSSFLFPYSSFLLSSSSCSLFSPSSSSFLPLSSPSSFSSYFSFSLFSSSSSSFHLPPPPSYHPLPLLHYSPFTPSFPVSLQSFISFTSSSSFSSCSYSS